MSSIRITTDRSIGNGHPCFVIAEIGINHNGDLSLAKEMIAAAAQSGADCVKFQNYRTEDFISDREQSYTYLSEGKEITESMYAMFKRYEINQSFLAECKESCDQQGVVFTSTPTSLAGIEDLCSVGAPLLKNGSDLLTDIRLIRQMAETGLPTILSTGMSTEAEIDSAVEKYREYSPDNLILLHCTSAYPTPEDETHLRKIHTLAQRYNCPIGLSDHTEGTLASCLAIPMGACVVEKHFTTDKTLPGPDQRFSSDADEFSQLIHGIRSSEKMLGASALSPSDSEAKSRDAFRLSCVATSDLPEGHVLTESDIAFRRPGTGVPPVEYTNMIGKMTRTTIARNHQIHFNQLI